MSEQPPFNMELAITAFRKARDILKMLDDEAVAKRKHVQEQKDWLEGMILHQLRITNQESARTAAGTATASTKWTATLSDKTAFMDFVIENKLFDLLDKKANSIAVREYNRTNKALPPGCNLNSHDTIKVRRPTTSSDSTDKPTQEEDNE